MAVLGGNMGWRKWQWRTATLFQQFSSYIRIEATSSIMEWWKWQWRIPTIRWDTRIQRIFGMELFFHLTLKAPSKICSRQHFKIFILCFYFSEKTRLDISCESSAWQMIHMKCQDSFSSDNKKKNKKKKNIRIVICFSCDLELSAKQKI